MERQKDLSPIAKKDDNWVLFHSKFLGGIKMGWERRRCSFSTSQNGKQTDDQRYLGVWSGASLLLIQTEQRNRSV